MADHHGATTIKQWMEDLVGVVRSGQEFETSAGAEPGRSYSYLEYHLSRTGSMAAPRRCQGR